MKKKILISGGGTGGHIFPALSIAKAIKRRIDADILFVGADNRMEMQKVPEAGFEIIGLPIAGFNRKNLLKNFSVLAKLFKSMMKAKKIIRDFKPDIAIGVGGYASGATLKAAQLAHIPTLVQEQNSYAGVTNKLLASKADKICVAYEGMEAFFPKDKIVLTGNPVRKDLTDPALDKAKVRTRYGLNPEKPTVLVIGGSLGARTLNESLEAGLRRILDAGIQVVWQTGKHFGNRAQIAAKGMQGTVVTEFITDMGAAYAAADLVVSRAGAGSISELQNLGKPCILVPSPNVAEDHQTKNALALANRNAAVMVTDAEARDVLVGKILELAGDKNRLQEMSANISAMALRDSDERIVDEIMKIIK